MTCINCGICDIGKKTPLRNIMGNVIVIMIIVAVSSVLVNEVMRMPKPTRLNTPRSKIPRMSAILPCTTTPKRTIESVRTMIPCNIPRMSGR